MSFSHMAQVRDIRGLSPSERALLYVLADFAASEGVGFGEAWPSQATLAEVLEVSERYVRGLLASLEAKGHITRRPGDRRGGYASSDRISVLPGRVARRSAASGPRRSVAPRRPGAARVPCGTMVPVATGTIVPPNLSGETIPLTPPPSSPRLPLDRGGAVKADLSSLTRYQQTCLREGKDLPLGGGVSLKPDAPEWRALSLALRAQRC